MSPAMLRNTCQLLPSRQRSPMPAPPLHAPKPTPINRTMGSNLYSPHHAHRHSIVFHRRSPAEPLTSPFQAPDLPTRPRSSAIWAPTHPPPTLFTSATRAAVPGRKGSNQRRGCGGSGVTANLHPWRGPRVSGRGLTRSGPWPCWRRLSRVQRGRREEWLGNRGVGVRGADDCGLSALGGGERRKGSFGVRRIFGDTLEGAGWSAGGLGVLETEKAHNTRPSRLGDRLQCPLTSRLAAAMRHL